MDAIPLKPIDVELYDPVFNALVAWPFTDEFVSRLLVNDIPTRLTNGSACMWAYEDPQKNIVGFGTLDASRDCAAFSEGKLHVYIPLLAVHPDFCRRGHGTTIVNHLVDEAARAVSEEKEADVHHALFLDVYEFSTDAIKLYTKNNFVKLKHGTLVDPENGKTYFVMARRVAA